MDPFRKRIMETLGPELTARFSEFSEKEQDAFFKVVANNENARLIDFRVTMSCTELRALAYLLQTRDRDSTTDVNEALDIMERQMMRMLGLALLPVIFEMYSGETRH